MHKATQGGPARAHPNPWLPYMIRGQNPQVDSSPPPSLAHAAVGEREDFYHRWDIFRPYLVELAGTQGDPWNIPGTAVLAAWSEMWGEEDAQLHTTRIERYVSLRS